MILDNPVGAAKERIDKRLVVLLGEAGVAATRGDVRRWIEGGHVDVERRGVRRVVDVPSAALEPGDRVHVTPQAPPATDALPEEGIAFDVVYEDAHLLVVDKPPGLVVHPAKGHERGTLVNGLLARGAFRALDGEGDTRPGIVHRIDKGTSGLLVVAKDAVTREALKGLFARHDIDREYLAIVTGEARDGTIDTPHGRHPTDRLRFTSRPRGPSKRAVTHVAVIERLRSATGGPATLVRCTLETGRTHQLRVHLAEQSRTPILGDPLYGVRPRDPTLAKLAATLGRQALHARVLGFVHPATGERVRWESELPADLRAVLDALRVGPGARATRAST